MLRNLAKLTFTSALAKPTRRWGQTLFSQPMRHFIPGSNEGFIKGGTFDTQKFQDSLLSVRAIANGSRAFMTEPATSSLFAQKVENQFHQLHLNQLLKDAIEKWDEKLILAWLERKQI